MRIGIIWEGLLEMNELPAGTYPILGEQDAGEKWDFIFDIKDECIEVCLHNKCIEFQIPAEQQELFINAWVMMLNDRNKYYNHDILDVVKFLFKKNADRIKGNFYVKDFDSELEEEIKRKRKIVMFTGMPIAVANLYLDWKRYYLNDKPMLIQKIDDLKQKKKIYIFTFENIEQ